MTNIACILLERSVGKTDLFSRIWLQGSTGRFSVSLFLSHRYRNSWIDVQCMHFAEMTHQQVDALDRMDRKSSKCSVVLCLDRSLACGHSSHLAGDPRQNSIMTTTTHVVIERICDVPILDALRTCRR